MVGRLWTWPRASVLSLHVSTTNEEKETTRVSSATDPWAFGPLNLSLLFSFRGEERGEESEMVMVMVMVMGK